MSNAAPLPFPHLPSAPPLGPDFATTQLAVRAANARKVYGTGDAAVVALDDVTVGFPAGRFTAIMGPSGSGKSTLLHLLAGLDTPTSGQVWLGDLELTALTDSQLTLARRDRVGFVFQAFNLLPMLTAEQNILLPLALAGRRVDPQWWQRIVSAVGIGDRLGHLPSELSGGQQQRVAMARALSTRPIVLFADEPTGALDSQTSAEMLDFLRVCVRELGQTVVMVTHDPYAAAYADAVVMLADGRVAGTVADPTPERILAAPAGSALSTGA